MKGVLKGQEESQGKSRILASLYGIREESCNKGGFSRVQIPVAFPVLPVQPSLGQGSPGWGRCMARGGPALQKRVASISAEEGIFLPFWEMERSFVVGKSRSGRSPVAMCELVFTDTRCVQQKRKCGRDHPP